jgi:hypothetical protein
MSKRSKILELQFQHLMRDGEGPLPFEFMGDNEVRFCAEFIATHRDQITLPPPSEDCCESFLELYCLIDHLRRLPILEIIDYLSFQVTLTIRKLKLAKFGGSWFDSLESLIANNLQYNSEHLLQLGDRENELKSESSIVGDRLVIFGDMQQRGGLTSERAKILRYRLKWFEKQEKLIKSELAAIIEKRNAISQARNSLNFFYHA